MNRPPATRREELGAALLGALFLAAASTLGDFIWFGIGLPHRMAYGLAHGALLCLAIGLFLGTLARRPWAGAAGGAAIGFLSAGGYYVLVPLTGPAVMFALWMALWVMLALLAGRLTSPVVAWGATLGRSGLAAALSGIAFYAVSGIWFARPANGRNYLVHFLSWALVFLPAFGILLYGRARPGERARTRGG